MAQIDVTIKGHDQLSPTMRECRGSVTDFNQALEIAGKVARTVGQIYEATVGEYIKYADAVGDLSSITGESTESTSRFVTVLGDFGIEMGQITAMGRAMRDDGLAPTLETLAQLSDRYLALAPGMDRINFLQETLGRQGAEYVDVLEEGSAAILERSQRVAAGNVLTEEEIANAERLQLELRELNTLYKSATRAVGEFVLEGLAPLGDAYADSLVARQRYLEITGEEIPNFINLNTEYRELYQNLLGFAEAQRLATAATLANTDAGADWALGADNQLDKQDLLAYEAGLTETAIEDLSYTQLLAAAFEAHLAGDTALEQRYRRLAAEIRNSASALREWIATVAEVNWAEWPSESRFVTVGGGGGGATAPGGGPAEGWGPWAAAHPGQFWTPGAAQGGPLGPITEVGEEGTEGIINGMVVPHDLWERLKRLGLMVDIQAQGGWESATSPLVQYSLAQQRRVTRNPMSAWLSQYGGSMLGGAPELAGQPTVGGLGMAPTPAPLIETIVEQVQQASAQEGAALVASIPAAAASAASEQGRQQVAEIRIGNAGQLAKLDQLIRAVNRLNETLPTVVRDAIERII